MDPSASTLARKARRVLCLLCICVVLFLAACARISQSLYLSGCDAKIKKATNAIEASTNTARRATAYADRGDAHAEKARYSRAFKLIPRDRYDQLFDLAVKDHGQAIALDPANPEMYFRRGRTFYFRAAQDLLDGVRSKDYFVLAKADFSTTIEKNPRHDMAFDMRGLIDEDTGDLDQAIADFAQEAALNARSRYRLADAYCLRGSANLRGKQYDAAAADFEKAIDIQTSSDPCECEPYNPLLAIYIETRPDCGKARSVVDRAKKAGRTVAPEYFEKLKTVSCTSNTP